MRILSFSELVPEYICDTVRFNGYAGERNISHYCGYVSDFITQVRTDASIDGAIFPKSCDSSRILTSYLEGTGKFFYQFPVPSRSDLTGIQYYANVLRNFEVKLKEYYDGYSVDIPGRIQKINKRNRSILEVYKDIESRSYYDFLCKIHDMLQRPLDEQEMGINSVVARNTTDKRVYLIGSHLASEQVVKIIEDSGLTVVGDNLPESGRLAERPEVECGGDLYESIAATVLNSRKSPTQNDFESILKKDLDDIKKRNARGVIFVTQKYCESYDYLYYVYRKELEKAGISSVQIILSDSEDIGKTELIMEAFSDTF